MAPIDESSSTERPLKREAGGGGCSSPNCIYPSTCRDSPNADCSVSSSCCPTRCGYLPPSSHRRVSDCRSCATPFKPILKKRACHRCTASSCACQPTSRGCGCPPPVTVDVRAVRECTCDCTSSPECACSPNERRFPRALVKCPDARSCCPAPSRLPSDRKCHCARCRPCSPSSCDPCAAVMCPSCSVRPSSSCRPPSPCTPCSSCRPASSASTRSSCRPATPCRKLTSCAERSGRATSSCARTGQSWCDIAGDEIAERDVGDDDVEELQGNDTRDRDGSCHCRRAASEDCRRERDDEYHDPIPNEGSVENSTSKTFISPSESREATSKSVDPALHDITQQAVESLCENTTAKVLEGCIAEKTLEKNPDERHASLPLVAPSDNRARPDRYVFREEHPSVDENIPGNPILARLSNRTESPARICREDLSAPSKLSPHGELVAPHGASRIRIVGPSPGVSMNTSTKSTRAIDRRHGDGKFSARNTLDLNYSFRESRPVPRNISKLSPVTRDRSLSAPLRSNRLLANLLRRKTKPPVSGIL